MDEVQPAFPPVLAQREAEHMVQEQINSVQQGSKRGNDRENLERYLQQVGKSEEELMEEVKPLAEQRIRRSLVLSEVTEAENIVVTDEDVEAEIERLGAGVGEQGDELRRLFSQEAAKENLRRSLITKKTLDRLVEIASSNGASQGETEEAEAGATEAG